MKTLITIIIFVTTFIISSSLTHAVEPAPKITDREIVEGLAGIRGDIKRLEADIKQLREDMKQIREETKQIREDVRGDIKQFREDINKQFDRVDSQFSRITQIMLGIVASFAALVGGTIWFALWDRKTMIRPFETKVKELEEDIAENRSKLHSLIETFRHLSKTDERVAEVLKRFNLL